MLEHAFAACLLLAAQNQGVPPAVLTGIMQVEGGRAGLEAGPNKNGTYDLGVMQINTLWLDELSKHWGVSKYTARRWVRDDSCINIEVAAWVLRRKIDEAGGSLTRGIAYYHSATPRYGNKYARKVISTMNRMGLIREYDG